MGEVDIPTRAGRVCSRTPGVLDGINVCVQLIDVVKDPLHNLNKSAKGSELVIGQYELSVTFSNF